MNSGIFPFSTGAISDKLLSPSEVYSTHSSTEVNSEVVDSDDAASCITGAVDSTNSHSTSDNGVSSLADQLSDILDIQKSKSSGSVVVLLTSDASQMIHFWRRLKRKNFPYYVKW